MTTSDLYRAVNWFDWFEPDSILCGYVKVVNMSDVDVDFLLRSLYRVYTIKPKFDN